MVPQLRFENVRRRSLVVAIAVAISMTASAMFVGCGLDVEASGAADGDATTTGEGGPQTNAEGGFVDGDGGAPGFPIDASAGEAGSDGAGPPADSGIGTILSISAATATGVVDLTGEGTIDWAH